MHLGQGQIVDVVALVLMLFAMIGGIRRGLSGELARVIGLAAAVYAAWYFADPVTHWLMDRNPEWTQQKAFSAGFAALLLAALLASWLLRSALRSIMTFAFKGKLERIGGGLCGLVRGSVLAALIILMLSLVPQEDVRRTVTEDSIAGRLVYEKLLPVYEDLREQAPELGLPAAPGETPAGESDLGIEIPAGTSSADAEPDPE